jgi:hypothetical protein
MQAGIMQGLVSKALVIPLLNRIKVIPQISSYWLLLTVFKSDTLKSEVLKVTGFCGDGCAATQLAVLI